MNRTRRSNTNYASNKQPEEDSKVIEAIATECLTKLVEAVAQLESYEEKRERINMMQKNRDLNGIKSLLDHQKSPKKKSAVEPTERATTRRMKTDGSEEESPERSQEENEENGSRSRESNVSTKS